MLDSEALFLVKHDKPEVVEFDVLRQHSVRTHRKEALAYRKSVESVVYLLLRLQPADKFYLYAEFFKSLHRRVVMLTGKYSGRTQYHRLLVVAYRLEYRPQRDFRLAVPNAKQPVHYHAPLHIRLYVGDGFDLVVCGNMLKCVFKFLLQIIVVGVFISHLVLSF